jgi:hypothetical protein
MASGSSRASDTTQGEQGAWPFNLLAPEFYI